MTNAEDMRPPAIERQEGGLVLTGSWTLAEHGRLKALLAQAAPPEQTVSLSGIDRLDTAGATLLIRWLGVDRLRGLLLQEQALAPERRALLETLLDALDRAPAPEAPKQGLLSRLLEGLGRQTQALGRQFWQQSGFVGLVLQSLLGILFRPGRWRITAFVNQVHQTGLNAVPIVALLTFLVGAVVAFLGATVLGAFGAEVYTVNLVAYSFLREFGVLLAAILMAGRTASAFTAQIGSMKANEELDALRTLGLNPVELLVIPRVLALMLTLPLLSFVAVVSGIIGGGVVSLLSLGISLEQFLGILADVPLNHYLVGMAKAPIFAFVVAIIGCLEGFKVSGSAESVGRHTTSSVVQSIFMVILLDAVAALFFMEMGW